MSHHPNFLKSSILDVSLITAWLYVQKHSLLCPVEWPRQQLAV
jgi:hypothetical protein